MMASRRAASPTGPSMKDPSLSGPRWTSVALIRAKRSASAGPFEEAIPQIPHTRVSLVAGPDQSPQRLSGDPGSCGDERPQVEGHRAVGDPLEVVRELLGHRGLVAASHLREARQTGADDEALPVCGQVRGELLEEPRPDRARPDQAHVAAEDVPELWQLVKLRCAQPPAEAGEVGARPPEPPPAQGGGGAPLRARAQAPPRAESTWLPPEGAAGRVPARGLLVRFAQPPPRGDPTEEERARLSRNRAETLTPCIIDPYGHEAAGSVLRRSRAAELLSSRGAARGDAACRQPPGSLARKATRPEAARPLRPPGRADRGRPLPLPRRPAPARARRPAARGA